MYGGASTAAVVGREHHERPREPDLAIHVGEQLGERPVESEEVVLALQARRAEQVPHVVGGGEADGEVVRHVVLAEPLVLDERLGEVEGQLVAGGAHGEERRVVASSRPGRTRGGTSAPSRGASVSYSRSSTVPVGVRGAATSRSSQDVHRPTRPPAAAAFHSRPPTRGRRRSSSLLVTKAPLAFENQNALPAWPARGIAPRSLTDTPKIFARPAVNSASSSENVDTRTADGRATLATVAVLCVGSISRARLSTAAPSGEQVVASGPRRCSAGSRSEWSNQTFATMPCVAGSAPVASVVCPTTGLGVRVPVVRVVVADSLPPSR